MQVCITDAPEEDLLEDWGHESKFFACFSLYPLAPWAPAVTAELQQQDQLFQQSNIWVIPPHHIFIPECLGASLKHNSVHSPVNTSLSNLRLQVVSQRYLWSLLHPAKYLQCNLEQMWYLWQNPQVHFGSTHGQAFTSISTCPGNLWWLPFPIPNLRCCLTTSFPHTFCPFTREQLLSHSLTWCRHVRCTSLTWWSGDLPATAFLGKIEHLYIHPEHLTGETSWLNPYKHYLLKANKKRAEV